MMSKNQVCFLQWLQVSFDRFFVSFFVNMLFCLSLDSTNSRCSSGLSILPNALLFPAVSVLPGGPPGSLSDSGNSQL